MPLLAHGRFTSTFPNTTTTINGDSEVTLKWCYTPDHNSADAFESQRVLCDLMWGDSGYRVSLLAQNVDPYDNGLKVFIRADYGFNSSQYYIRYRTSSQQSTAYSERFTLTNMDGPDLSAAVVSHGSGGVAPGASRLQVSGRLSVPTTASGFVVSSSTTHKMSISSTSSASTTRPSVDQPVGPFVTLPSPTHLSPTQTTPPEVKSNGANTMSLARQQDSTWKKVSILLWPVLVGAIMAM
ncbi:hypothetical protein RhiJN_21852 [Ceratobasidium sp. AG-Ba]|nr:hypothetical protein RhiJN_21852 [Ceratobasidium sp. AG-Ba]